MKNLLIAFLFIPFLSQGQFRTFTPTGTRTSLTPAVTITNSTVETTLYSEVIPANTLVQGKYYQFRIDIAVSTPVVNIANLTIRVKYGSQTVSIINGAALGIGMSNLTPITISGYLVSRGLNNQFVPITVSQSMGNTISLTTSNANARGLMTVNAAQDQTFAVTAQFGGVGGGNCTLVADWFLKNDF